MRFPPLAARTRFALTLNTPASQAEAPFIFLG
jgi:hypothetical protein